MDFKTVLSILVEINQDIPKLLTLLAQVDANPTLWQLPGLNKLQPYEQEVKDLLAFLQKLDDVLVKILTPLASTTIPIEPGQTPPIQQA